MHNLHFVVVPAETGKDACHIVEDFIEDWGTENNWRTVDSAISEDNEIYEGGEGRFTPTSQRIKTIDDINALVASWRGNENLYTAEGEKLVKKHLSGKPLTSHEWWQVSKWAKKKSAVARGGDNFNVLEHAYYEYEYDENGVTQIGYKKEKNEKLWVVFVDMHS